MPNPNRNLVQRDMQQFRRALAVQGETPPNGDQYFGSLAQAIYIETAQDGSLRQETERMFELRRGTDNSVHPVRVGPNLVTRAIHRLALAKVGRYDYLRYFDPSEGGSVDRYRDFINSEEVVESDDLAFDLAVRTVQSNLFARGEAQKLMMNLFPERYGENPTLFEAGCSLNLIIKWLVEGKPTSPTVLNPDGSFSPELTRSVRWALIGHLGLRYGLGLDQWEYRNDPNTLDWELACSTTPNDMKNRPQMVDETYRLSNISPPQVLFHRMNFLEPYDVNLFPPRQVYGRHVPHASQQPPPVELGIDRFDTAFSSTTTYLLRSKADRQKLEDFLIENTRDDAIVANQDFGIVNSKAPCGLDIAKNIYERDFIYNYVFFDKLNPTAGWQNGFTFKSGRAEQMIVGNGGVMVDGQIVSIRDRLLETPKSSFD